MYIPNKYNEYFKFLYFLTLITLKCYTMLKIYNKSTIHKTDTTDIKL